MRIKFVSKTPLERMAPLWNALVPPGGFPGATFTFDPNDRHYDALCIYEDFPPDPHRGKVVHTERLACPRRRTLLITTEPSSIRLMGPHYMAQFGHVWTSVRYKDAGINPARGLIADDSLWRAYNSILFKGRPSMRRRRGALPPPLRWFYGRDFEGTAHVRIETLAKQHPPKSADLSTVTSTKAMDHTVHKARLDFVQALKARMGDDIILFGRGFHDLRDKAEAMAPYRYHLAIENHIQSGHHTEKLTDCFLAECLPFYFGDPDYDKVYPKQAVIPIDITDLDGAERIIRETIAANAWERRLPAIRKAKRRALSLANPVAQAANWAGELDMAAPSSSDRGSVIHGRHSFRRAHPFLALRDLAAIRALARTRIADPLQGLDALRVKLREVSHSPFTGN